MESNHSFTKSTKSISRPIAITSRTRTQISSTCLAATPNTTNIYAFILFRSVKGRSPEYQEPLDLRSNLLQGGGDDAILPPKGIG